MRFSDFLLVSDPTDLNFIVGYTDEQNIRINVLDLFTGQIIGSGTAGYVPLFTAANVIDDSVIFQHGSNIVIGGVDSLGYKLAVSGSLYSSNGAVINSTVSGADALRVIGGDGDIFVIPNDLGQSISSLRRIIHPPAILTTESATLGQVNTAISNLEEDIEILLDLKVDKTSVGEPNGVASLDATGKIPLSEIPDSIIGQVEYMGTWNAFTNTPTLNPLVPEQKGHYYVVSAAGVFGGVDYAVGDWIISNGVEWQKVDNTDAVTSVFGRIGAILPLEADYQSFYPRLSQAYDNPTWINSLAFTKITGVPPFLLENQTITLSGDVTGSGKTSISSTISNNAVSNEKLRDSVGTSVIGRAANSTGDPADIQASTDGHVLLRSAGNLLFGLISSDSISSINWSKITGTPTTLSGYGITDAYTKTESDNKFVPYTGANANVNLGSNNITANSFIKAGGTSSQFLKADGSVDTSQYVPTTRSVNAGTGLTGGGNLSSDVTISFDTTWGDTRYAYRTRQLTINGITFDLSSDRTWNVGTVTSVGLSAPTGFAVSNSPVTSSGTLALSFASGYSLPTNAVQANWTTAYNDSIISAAVTGTATKTLTLNQQDGGTITASWSDIDTAPVTSVFGRLGDVVAQSGDYNTSQVTESGNLYFTNARSRSAVSLTTTGTSGVATYDTGTGVFNIPNYGSALTGYVPYTGANQTVNLNTQQLQAGHATFTTNGSTDTLTINHTSGSGRGIVVTKSGSGEGLTVVKSSGSGNVASITGGITLLTTLNLTNALADTYIASAANWNTAYNNRITSLTTTGTSGVATLISHVLNIPQYQAQGNYITSLTGEATASGPGAASVTLTNSAVTGKVLTGLTVAGSSIASTDSILTAFGKLQGQVNDLIGGLQYQGTWNASTNTPAITSGVGTDGHFYIVSVAGNTTIDGVSGWQIGDWIVFHSPAWQKVDNTESVVSVNGLTGAVTLTTSNITEGTNLYFTNARARTAISLTTTGNSGASNYDNGTGVLNVPQYSLAGLGGVPTTRALTINGINFDLSADRNWSVGTVTNIATSGPITGGPITGTGTIGITQASSTSDGFLSSTDWNTFNGKQNALTNPVTGTGTLNYHAKWVSGSAIGNSLILDDGTNVGINTTSLSKNINLAGTTRHERIYAYPNYVFDFTNSVGETFTWFRLGNATPFSQTKIYYRAGTGTSEEEGEVKVSNTCAEPFIEWTRNTYSYHIREVRARMTGGCGACEIWFLVRHGNYNAGANTNFQWQIHSGTDSAFVVANAIGTPGTGTNQKSINSTDGYFYNNSGNTSIAGVLGVGTTAPSAQVHIKSGGSFVNTDANNRIIVERDAHTYLMFVSPNEFDQGIHFAKSTTGAITGRIAYHQRATGDFMSFTVASAIRMQLFDTGNLYVGSSPSDAGFRLDVNGTSRFQSTVNMNGNLNLSYSYPRINLIDTDNNSDYSIINADGTFTIYDDTNAQNRIVVSPLGLITLPNLAGTGTRMVVADASGALSTQAIGSGAITGSGTTNTLPKFTGASTIGNSAITDDGTTVTLLNRALSGSTATFSGNVTTSGGNFRLFNGYFLTAKRADGVDINVLGIEGGGNDLISVTAGSFKLRNTGGGDAANLLMVNSAGNLGLGVTPPAWSTFKAINIFGGSFSTNSLVGGGVVIARNWYFDGGEKYYGDGTAQRLELVSNGFFFQTAVNNTSGGGAALTWSTPMILTAAGNLGLGTSATPIRLSGRVFSINDTSANLQSSIELLRNGASSGEIFVNSDNMVIGSFEAGIPLTFRTQNQHRVSIFSGTGNMFIGDTPSDSGARLQVVGNSTEQIQVRNSGGGGSGIIGTDTSGNLLIDAPSNIYFQALSGTNTTIIGTVGQIMVNSSSNSTFTGTGFVGINTNAPNRNLTVFGTTRHGRVYGYDNNSLSIPNSVSFGTVWVHLGTCNPFTTDKIYYRVATNSSEEEGEITVSNTCSFPFVQWQRNTYNPMVAQVKARMTGGCGQVQVWLLIRYGSDFGGSATNFSWQAYNGTDSGFGIVNAIGTPGTGTNEKNIVGSEGYFYANSGSITVADNIGVGTTSPVTKLHVSHNTVISDALGLLLVENTNTSSGTSSTNSAVNIRNFHGTSQFMQWQNFGIRLGSRLLTNGGAGDLYLTSGADSVAMTLRANGNIQIGGTFADNGYKFQNAGNSVLAGQVVQGGGTGRSTAGTTVAFTGGAQTVWSANSDPGDGGRFLSIVNESSSTNAFSALSFRVNPGGANTGNAMLDVKFVNNGSNTSGLYWTFSTAGGFSDRMILTNGGTLSVSGDVIAFASSDRRLKDNLTRIESSLEKVGKLSGYSFDWNSNQETYSGKDYGVVAQEVEAIFPELVKTRDNGYKAVKYEKLIPVLIEAIKELNEKVEKLK
jgi:hypothetical protein